MLILGVLFLMVSSETLYSRFNEIYFNKQIEIINKNIHEKNYIEAASICVEITEFLTQNTAYLEYAQVTEDLQNSISKLPPHWRNLYFKQIEKELKTKDDLKIIFLFRHSENGLKKLDELADKAFDVALFELASKLYEFRIKEYQNIDNNIQTFKLGICYKQMGKPTNHLKLDFKVKVGNRSVNANNYMENYVAIEIIKPNNYGEIGLKSEKIERAYGVPFEKRTVHLVCPGCSKGYYVICSKRELAVAMCECCGREAIEEN
jgi:hypothetical protein